jgi:hypothetical protein
VRSHGRRKASTTCEGAAATTALEIGNGGPYAKSWSHSSQSRGFKGSMKTDDGGLSPTLKKGLHLC